MAQIGNVTSINSVKEKLDTLKEEGLIKEWELPYENILTRLCAAIFFLTPAEGAIPEKLWAALQIYNGVRYRLNVEKKLSMLEWRIEFDQPAES